MMIKEKSHYHFLQVEPEPQKSFPSSRAPFASGKDAPAPQRYWWRQTALCWTLKTPEEYHRHVMKEKKLSPLRGHLMCMPFRLMITFSAYEWRHFKALQEELWREITISHLLLQLKLVSRWFSNLLRKKHFWIYIRNAPFTSKPLSGRVFVCLIDSWASRDIKTQCKQTCTEKTIVNKPRTEFC